MEAVKSKLSIILTGVAFFVLIMDSKTAMQGAYEGLRLCLNTVIPSLFPLFVITTMLVGVSSSSGRSAWKKLSRLLHLSENAGTIFAVGLLGGYPVGAQSIRLAWDNGQISKLTAKRLLAFCNNAGPSFILGIGASIMPDIRICWVVWLIQILSACIICLMTPSHPIQENVTSYNVTTSIVDAIHRSIRVMATVCSWIVLFKIILTFLSKWVLWLVPEYVAIVFCGLLELANGCTELTQISSVSLRFILFTAMLGGGGLCVAMQTKAVLAGSGLSLWPYVKGKLVQCALSGTFSILLLPVIFHEPISPNLFVWVLFSVLMCSVYIISERKSKKCIAFLERMVYNGNKSSGGNTYEVIS